MQVRCNSLPRHCARDSNTANGLAGADLHVDVRNRCERSRSVTRAARSNQSESRSGRCARIDESSLQRRAALLGGVKPKGIERRRGGTTRTTADHDGSKRDQTLACPLARNTESTAAKRRSVLARTTARSWRPSASHVPTNACGNAHSAFPQAPGAEAFMARTRPSRRCWRC